MSPGARRGRVIASLELGFTLCGKVARGLRRGLRGRVVYDGLRHVGGIGAVVAIAITVAVSAIATVPTITPVAVVGIAVAIAIAVVGESEQTVAQSPESVAAIAPRISVAPAPVRITKA